MKIVTTYPLGLAPSPDMKPGHHAILVIDDNETHFEEYVVRRGDTPDAKMDAVSVEWKRVSTRDASGWTWTSHDTFVESVPCIVLEEMFTWCRNPFCKLAAVIAPREPAATVPTPPTKLLKLGHAEMVLAARACFGDDAKVVHGMFLFGNHGEKDGLTTNLIAGVGAGADLEPSKDHVAWKATLIVIPHTRGSVVTQSAEDFLENPRQWFPPKGT